MTHLNSGQGIVNHASHSNSGVTPPLYSADVDSLSNGDKLFIFYTMGCLANKFDISDAISEHYINNADGGAVAFIGNSRYGWFSPGHPGNGTSDKYDKEFFKRLFDDGYNHIGETLAMSKKTYLGSSGSDGAYRWVQFCLNLLGDPEMTIHTSSENCKPITVHNEGDADLIVSNIELGYQSGEPTGWLDANPKSFTVSPSGSEPMSVCVDCTGLSPDEYHGWLNIRSNDPDEDPYTVTVTLCVNGPWGDDPSNPCKERRLTCSGTYEYRNKPDGTICGHGEWEDDPANPCKERRGIQKCVSGTCTPSGEYEYRNKADGTICGCTASDTLKRCYSGVCTDTGICDATTCGADAACDGKKPGESCGANKKCDSNCKCGAVGEDYGVFRNGLWILPPNYRFNFGMVSDIPVTGDWNGNSVDTIGVRRGSQWILSNSNAAPSVAYRVNWGMSSDIPVTGDWNGNSVDTIGVRRGRQWILSNSNAAPSVAYRVNWGMSSDIPVVGDWNGDGVDTIGVRRGSQWILSNSNTAPSVAYRFNYGLSSDIPVVGDWNGDGVDTIGVRRGSQWILSNSNTAPSVAYRFNYGMSSDEPVTGDWI